MSGEKITVKLDRVRELKYDLNAGAVIAEHGGLDEKNPNSLSNLRLMLYAGLIHEDPDLTLEQVGAMARLRQLPKIAEAVSRALERDSADPEEAESKPRPPKARKRSQAKSSS